MTPEQAFPLLVQLVGAITLVQLGSPLVTALTSIIKRYTPFDPRYINLILQVIFWVAYEVALRILGVAQADVDQTVQLVTTIVTAFGGFFGSLVKSGQVYQDAVQAQTVIVGYQRTDPFRESILVKEDVRSPKRE